MSETNERPVRQWHELPPAEQARVMAGLRALAQKARLRQKPTADYWLVRDEARVSWDQLRRAVEEQRGKYAAWIAGRDVPRCDRPCCQAAGTSGTNGRTKEPAA